MRSVTIIGAGAVGRSLAFALRDGGTILRAVFSKNGLSAQKLALSVKAPYHGASTDPLVLSPLVIIAVPDDEIRTVAESIAERSDSFRGTVFLHMSGALTSDELTSLKRKGASAGSFHPLQTFSRHKRRTRFTGVTCAIEGDVAAVKAARDVARAIGAHQLLVRKKDKVFYHIAAVFASNYLVTLLSAAEQAGRAISIQEKEFRRIITPLVEQTAANVLRSSPAEALTGPIQRGDSQTVSRHLRALETSQRLNHLLPLYAALGLETARLAKRRT